MADFIHNKKSKNNTEDDITALFWFGQTAWSFISSIYKAGWDFLKANNLNGMFRQNVALKFIPKIINKKPDRKVESNIKRKQAEIARVPLPIPPRPTKETLEKSKIFQKKGKNSKNDSNDKNRHSYAQASAPNIKKILKLKKKLPNLSLKKIEDIYKMINNSGKVKPRINMITKGPSRRQIILSMGTANVSKFMALSGNHIANINEALKNIKSDIFADFV